MTSLIKSMAIGMLSAFTCNFTLPTFFDIVCLRDYFEHGCGQCKSRRSEQR